MGPLGDVTKKRGRGRPRKFPTPIPEEVIISSAGVDLADIEAHMPATVPNVEVIPEEEEVFHLSGEGSVQPPVEPPPPPAPEEGPPPQIIYIPSPDSHNGPEGVDEKKEKQRRLATLTKIKRYREQFSAVHAMKFSEEWSIEALESHLEDVRIMVSSKTTGLLVKSAYIAGVKGIEIVTTSAGMKTYGLADLLAKNQEVDSILKELQCELGIGTIPPAHRLALATISTVFVLDSVNKRAEVLGHFTAGPVKPDLETKFKDL